MANFGHSGLSINKYTNFVTHLYLGLSEEPGPDFENNTLILQKRAHCASHQGAFAWRAINLILKIHHCALRSEIRILKNLKI